MQNVIDRINKNVKQTTAGALMAGMISKLHGSMNDPTMLDHMITMSETGVEFWGRKIREYKYGMFLSGKWFKEFSEVGNQELQNAGWKFKIVCSKTEGICNKT